MSEKVNQDWKQIMEHLCNNNKDYTDEKFAEQFTFACSQIPEGEEVSHVRSSEIIWERVHRYCKEKKIEVVDYDGPMPFRFSKADEK